ncbi:MAG: hypothetical protein LBB75_06240 [Oscillospiraceae bacterium]|jgi:glutamate--cysteine ligase|nr:hypothetical protein [Oscillospiraceae bacterium]
MVLTDSLLEEFVRYFSGGCKAPGEFKTGFELEHFIVDAATRGNVNYSQPGGAAQLLEELAPRFPARAAENGRILGLSDGEMAISLEPGGQLEVSVAPKARIAETRAVYRRFRALVDPPLERRGHALEQRGYLPASSVRDIELIPKERYRRMDAYFRGTGGMGAHMMRGTAACHVSIDYASEADFVDKYRCAWLLGPALAYIASNAPVFEGRPNGNKLLRARIWRGVDSARCLVPGVFGESFGFGEYAKFVLRAPEIFPGAGGGGDRVPLALSLVFPEVRLRQYIEIRAADSMPEGRAFAYMALVKGLFADMPRLRALLSGAEWSQGAVLAAQDAIMRQGGDASVYGRPLARFAEELAGLARQNLGGENTYLGGFAP